MTMLILAPEIDQALERLMRAGRFETREHAIAEAVALLDERESAWAELDAAIMQGIQSADAGRLISARDAAEELRRRYA